MDRTQNAGEKKNRNLKPGGWIEIQELGGRVYCDDGSLPTEYSPHRFLDLCQEALSKFGSNFRIGNELEEPLKTAGFVNVAAKKLKVPIGTWPKVGEEESTCLKRILKKKKKLKKKFVKI